MGNLKLKPDLFFELKLKPISSLLNCAPELGEAIERVDSLTDNYPVHYMINCAHPTHFSHLFRYLDGRKLRQD